MATHKPDGWVCIKVNLDTSPAIFKIFGSWGGNFESSDAWRLSSGFTDGNGVTLKNGLITFPQSSGSIYQVNTAMQNILTSYNRSVLEHILRSAERDCEEEKKVSVAVIELNCDSLSKLREQLSQSNHD